MTNIVPIKTYEYIAMRKPAVATNLSGIQKEFGLDSRINHIENSFDVLEKSIWRSGTNGLEAEGEKAFSYVQNLSWDIITG